MSDWLLLVAFFVVYLVLTQRVEWSENKRRLRFFMDVCRVQETRRRKGLPDFPCKSVGTVEFETFTRPIDSCIRATLLALSSGSGGR
jgi:Family of unknown function (DUF6125)